MLGAPVRCDRGDQRDSERQAALRPSGWQQASPYDVGPQAFEGMPPPKLPMPFGAPYPPVEVDEGVELVVLPPLT